MHQNKSDTLKSIQKTKYKRNILPKNEIIQLYLNSSVGSNAKSKVVLPKFSNNDITTHLTNVETGQNLPKTENCGSNESNMSNASKKLSKETNKLKTVLNEPERNDSDKNMQKILSNLAQEFILDCKQRLDSENFSILLSLLEKYHSIEQKDDLNSNDLKFFLHSIYDLIKSDNNLCQKFSAFLTNEYALEFDLLLEASQHEKTLDFFQKLELLIPNRSSFRKLLQSLISLTNFSSNMDNSISKMEYIKSKIRSITKNNALVNIDLDHLFDQRFVNIEPIYEKINLTDEKLKNSLDHEYIDLTIKFNETSKKNVKSLKNKMVKNSKKNFL